MNKSSKNIYSALISRLITVFGPFLVRTIIIYKLGNEYVGLSSLFASILQVLSLAELGIGSVLTFSMYRPVVENDIEKLRILLNFYRFIYRIIGVTIIAVAMVLTPFIPYLIKRDCPKDINVYILFWIYITNTAASYLLFAYRSSILVAYQRNNIAYLTDTFSKMVMYILQILVLIFTRNYYAYIIILPINTIFNNLIVYLITKKLYPDIYPQGKLERTERNQVFKQLKSLFIHRVAGVLILSLDNIVISTFLGLKILAVYSNYQYVVTAVNGFLDVALASITSIIGTNLISYTDTQKYLSFKKASTLSMTVVALCSICMFNLYQPFISMWVGKSNLLSNAEMCIFCIYFYTYKVRAILMTYRDAAGLWKQDVWKSIIGLIFNLIGNIVLIKQLGAVGVLITTIIIMVFLFYPWEVFVLFKYLFKRNSTEYLHKTLKITLITAISTSVSYLVLTIGSSTKVLDSICRLVITIIVFFGCFYIFFRNTEDYSDVKDIAYKIIGKMHHTL